MPGPRLSRRWAVIFRLRAAYVRPLQSNIGKALWLFEKVTALLLLFCRGGIYLSRGVGGGGKVRGRHECLPYKPFGYSILSKSGIKISMF